MNIRLQISLVLFSPLLGHRLDMRQCPTTDLRNLSGMGKKDCNHYVKIQQDAITCEGKVIASLNQNDFMVPGINFYSEMPIDQLVSEKAPSLWNFIRTCYGNKFVLNEESPNDQIVFESFYRQLPRDHKHRSFSGIGADQNRVFITLFSFVDEEDPSKREKIFVYVVKENAVNNFTELGVDFSLIRYIKLAFKPFIELDGQTTIVPSYKTFNQEEVEGLRITKEPGPTLTVYFAATKWKPEQSFLPSVRLEIDKKLPLYELIMQYFKPQAVCELLNKYLEIKTEREPGSKNLGKSDCQAARILNDKELNNISKDIEFPFAQAFLI